MYDQNNSGSIKRVAAVVLAGALILGLNQAAANATTDLSVNLPDGPVNMYLAAVDGDAMLAESWTPSGDSKYRLSSDGGSTWVEANLPAFCTEGCGFGTPADGVVAVDVRSETEITTIQAFSLTNNATVGSKHDVGETIRAARGSQVLLAENVYPDPNYYTLDVTQDSSPAAAPQSSQGLTAGGVLTAAVSGGTLTVAEVDSSSAETVLKTVNEVASLDWIKSVGGRVAFSYTDSGAGMAQHLCYFKASDPTISACRDWDAMAQVEITEVGVVASSADDEGEPTEPWSWYPISDSGWGSVATITGNFGSFDEVSWANQGGGQPVASWYTESGKKFGQLQADGKLNSSGDLVTTSVAPTLALALTPTTVLGLDDRNGDIANGNTTWSRSVGSSLGSEAKLATNTSTRASVVASAGRWVVPINGGAKFYVNGSLTSTASGFAEYKPVAASGPYLLVNTAPVNGDLDWKVRLPSGAYSAVEYDSDLFGSLLVEETDSEADTIRVRDLSGAVSAINVPISNVAGSDDLFSPKIWGDWVGVTKNGDANNSVVVYNYRTKVTKSRAGSLVSLGDGFAVVETGSGLLVWNFLTNATVSLAATADHVAISNGRVAYPDYEAGKLFVKTLGSSYATSAVRSLGITAPAAFKPASGAFKLNIDLSKPVSAGKLLIKKNGSTLASIATPATTTGTLTGITWSGKVGGALAAPGKYSIEMVYGSGNTAVKSVTGTTTVLGSVVVGSLSFAKTYTPTISGKAKVKQKLKVKMSAWSPAASFSYQWLRNGKAIAGAKKSSYKLTKKDKGKKISVRVTGSKPGYLSMTKTSKATKKVK